MTIRDEWNMHDGLHRLVVGVQGQEVGGWLGSSVSAQVGISDWYLAIQGCHTGSLIQCYHFKVGAAGQLVAVSSISCHRTCTSEYL